LEKETGEDCQVAKVILEIIALTGQIVAIDGRSPPHVGRPVSHL
jgi:hypothetical protein